MFEADLHPTAHYRISSIRLPTIEWVLFEVLIINLASNSHILVHLNAVVLLCHFITCLLAAWFALFWITLVSLGLQSSKFICCASDVFDCPLTSCLSFVTKPNPSLHRFRKRLFVLLEIFGNWGKIQGFIHRYVCIRKLKGCNNLYISIIVYVLRILIKK